MTEFDWSQFDAYSGSDSWITFPELLEQLQSDDLDTANRGSCVLTQWPYEDASVLGRVGAVPTVIDFILEMLKSNTVPFPSIALSVAYELRERVSFYVFPTRYYSGSRVSLWEDVDRRVDSASSLIGDLLKSHDHEVRYQAVRLLKLIDCRSIAPIVRARLIEEDDERVLKVTAEILGTPVGDQDHQSLVSLQQSPHKSVRYSAAQALARSSGKTPNPWLRSLCEASFQSITTPNQEDWDAFHGIEGLSQDAWAFAMAFFMDHMDRMSGDELVNSMHTFVQIVLRWHWNLGFLGYFDRQNPRLVSVLLGYLANCHEYWENVNATHDKHRSWMLTQQFGFPSERVSLHDLFGQYF